MKHLNDMSAFDAVFAALCGLALGSILWPAVAPLAYAVANAVGLR